MLSEQHLSWEPRVHFLLVKEKAISSQAILGESKQFFNSVWFCFIHRENDSGYLPGSSLLFTGLSAPGSCSSANSLPFNVVSFLWFYNIFSKCMVVQTDAAGFTTMTWLTHSGLSNLDIWTKLSKLIQKNLMTYLQHRSTLLWGLKTDNHAQDRACDLFARETHHNHFQVTGNILGTSSFRFYSLEVILHFQTWQDDY